MDKNNYVEKYYPLAKAAGERYNIHPVVILAQGSVENAWGDSSLAINANNHFGVTAGSGKTNEYWNGDTVKTSKGLVFRKYKTAQDSYFDFARLIRSFYTSAANSSGNFAQYAAIISQSPYISEKNGDNREDYRKGIETRAKIIFDILKKKGFISEQV